MTREEQLKEMRREFARSGGKARSAKLTPEERSEAARNAAKVRWQKAKGSK